MDYMKCSKHGPIKVVPKARASDPATSHIAAISMTDGAQSQRAQILATLKAQGPMTADALDATLDLRVTSAGRRLPELQEMGFVRMTPQTGTTRSGRPAHLWEAT